MEEIVTEFLTANIWAASGTTEELPKFKAIEEKYCKKEYIK